jgi:hypothetical protein
MERNGNVRILGKHGHLYVVVFELNSKTTEVKSAGENRVTTRDLDAHVFFCAREQCQAT